MADSSTILIVDDDPVVRKLATKAIVALGYQAVDVETGHAGLDYLAEETPSMILLDIMMPEMDGFEFLEGMNQRNMLNDIPVVMFSALSEEHLVRKALDLGADDYIIKPFRLRLVQNKVTETLQSGLADAFRDVDPVRNNHRKPRARVLVVTTNRLKHAHLARELPKHGVSGLFARGAWEALRLVGPSAPDLVYIDHKLPVFEPRDLQEKIEDHVADRKFQVICEEADNPEEVGSQVQQAMDTILQFTQNLNSQNGSNGSAVQDTNDPVRLLWLEPDEEEREAIEDALEAPYQCGFAEDEDELVGRIVRESPAAVLIGDHGRDRTAVSVRSRCKDVIWGIQAYYYLVTPEYPSESLQIQASKDGFHDVVQWPAASVPLIPILNKALQSSGN